MKIRILAIVALCGVCSSPGFAQNISETPDNIVSTTISEDVRNIVDNQFNVGHTPGTLSPDPTNSVFRFTEDSHVSVTFESERTGHWNTLGYYTYEQGAFDNVTFGDIDTDSSGNISLAELSGFSGVNDLGVVFANASAVGSSGDLVSGDTTVIGGGSLDISGGAWDMADGAVFEAGTDMGFFLMQNGWSGTGVKNLDYPDQDAKTFFTTEFLNHENSASATLSNPDGGLSHVSLVALAGSDEIVVGFEDMHFTANPDYDENVFVVRSGAADTTSTTVSGAPSPAIGGLGMVAALVCGAYARRRRDVKTAS